MKFLTISSQLLSKIRMAKQMLERKNILAILNYGLVTKNGDELRLVCARPESITSVKLDFAEEETEDFTPFCIDVSYLSDALKIIPDQPVEISVDPLANFASEVKYALGVFKFNSLSASDFPRKEPIADANLILEFSLPSSVLVSALTAASASTGTDTARTFCESVLLDVTEENVTIVGTDTVRLFLQTLHFGSGFLSAGSSGQIVIHRSLIAALTATLGKNETTKVRFDGKSVEFITGTSFTSLSVSTTKYPNYRRIIPETYPHHIKLSKSVLTLALEASIVTTQTAVLTRDVDNVCMLAYDNDNMRHNRSILPCAENTLPEGFKIGLDLAKFLSLLKNIDSDDVVISLDSANRPILVKSAQEDNSIVQLLMPKMCN